MLRLLNPIPILLAVAALIIAAGVLVSPVPDRPEIRADGSFDLDAMGELVEPAPKR